MTRRALTKAVAGRDAERDDRVVGEGTEGHGGAIGHALHARQGGEFGRFADPDGVSEGVEAIPRSASGSLRPVESLLDRDERPAGAGSGGRVRSHVDRASEVLDRQPVGCDQEVR